MTVRMWTKRETQAALRALRAAGFHEEKNAGGYTVSPTKGAKPCFRAMNGTRGYLVRHDDDLFAYAGESPRANVG